MPDEYRVAELMGKLHHFVYSRKEDWQKPQISNDTLHQFALRLNFIDAELQAAKKALIAQGKLKYYQSAGWSATRP